MNRLSFFDGEDFGDAWFSEDGADWIHLSDGRRWAPRRAPTGFGFPATRPLPLG